MERGDEGIKADAQGADGEYKIEDHEGVEVGVEDCFCSVGAFSEWVEGSWLELDIRGQVLSICIQVSLNIFICTLQEILQRNIVFCELSF